MILGVVVVLLVGLIAYNYFRSHREVVPVKISDSVTQVGQTAKAADNKTAAGQVLDQGQSAVALPTSHTVAAGENLWTIAERYYKSGYNYVDIAKVNQLASANTIYVGQKLTIPNVSVRQPISVANANTPIVTASRIADSSYTVIKGDSIWDIAVRAYGDGFAYIKIVQANHLSNPGLIHPGNVLVIPRQ